MFTSLFDLDNYRSIRHKHASISLCNALKMEDSVTPFVLFSMAFIWHCHAHLSIDLFDNNDIEDLHVHNMYLQYHDIYNKKTLTQFFINSKNVFNLIKKTHMRKAIKLFEEDNNCSAPHGYLSSMYNIKQITNEFTKSLGFKLNDMDAQIVSKELSCR